MKTIYQESRGKLPGIFGAAALMLTLMSNSMAQDAAFSQFYASPVYLNPAMAGSKGGARIVTSYRNQWPGINKGYRTYAVSYDQHFDKLSGGLGIHVMNDNAGDMMSSTSAGLAYAYRLNISRTVSLSAALEASMIQKKINWDNLTFGDMLDPRLGIVYQSQEKRPGESKSILDLCAGVLAFSKSVYGGFSLSHLTRPDESFIASGTGRLPVKIAVHAGAVIPVGEKVIRFNAEEESATVSPNILLLRQGKFNQFNLGSYFQKSAFVCGIWFRGNLNENKHISSESFITLVGIQKGIFKLGYSYDFTLNKLTSNTGGTHEISAGLQFASPAARKKRFKAVHCPTF